jgi:GH15 family glucan-1,4-alpha-glucosidase
VSSLTSRRAEASPSARGYVPIGDYAAIGDGRTVALVARDGSVDWLCLPDLDSPSVFAAVLDADRGGSFALQPESPAEVRRRYLPDTNVLETTFTTGEGVVRVTDAMALPNSELLPTRELIRRVDGVAGRVPMRWRIMPTFGYGDTRPRLERRGQIPVAVAGPDALAVCCWQAGEARLDERAIFGRFEAREPGSALIALCAAHQEPLVFPSREHLEERFKATVAYWQHWAAQRAYHGPWRDAVIRSALRSSCSSTLPPGSRLSGAW